MWILLVKTGKHAAQTACESVLFRPTQDRQPVFRTLRKSCKGHLGGPEEPASGQLCSTSLPAPRPPHPIPPRGGCPPRPPPVAWSLVLANACLFPQEFHFSAHTCSRLLEAPRPTWVSLSSSPSLSSTLGLPGDCWSAGLPFQACLLGCTGLSTRGCL